VGVETVVDSAEAVVKGQYEALSYDEARALPDLVVEEFELDGRVHTIEVSSRPPDNIKL